MDATLPAAPARPRLAAPGVTQLLANPAMALFVSANFVNVGNLGFNILFSRWMGAEAFGDLALLLTVKLSILCVLNALQFELASRIAAMRAAAEREAAARWINRISVSIGSAVLGIVALAAVAAWLLTPAWLWSAPGGVSIAFLLFAFSLPFMSPMIFARGWSQGTLDVRRVVASAQLEMVVRLGGSALAWHLGAGLPGIAVAIVLSIIAGWWATRPPMPAAPTHLNTAKAVAAMAPGRSLLLAALPWACLQLGQVLALDGDFLAAKLFLDPLQGGLTAVTALVQRILFFGSFGLATAVLPLAVTLRSRAQVLTAIRPVIGLFLLSSLPVIAVMILTPNLFLQLVFGPHFMAAGPALVYSALSGASFVAVYLIATFFMARSRPVFGYGVLAVSILQFAMLSAMSTMMPDVDMVQLVKAKSFLQLGLAAFTIWIAHRELCRLDPK